MNSAYTTLQLLLEKLWQQIFLVLVTMFFAILIGVSLGILITHIKRLKNPIIHAANVLQTIPSLALFGLLIPLLGIGRLPAIIALCLYALLPIIRNTATGIETIDIGLKETAVALGLTSWQRLYKLELPIAMPMIMSGIRTATTMCVGIATIAAFIGAGGLGDLIYQGLALNSNRYLLLGAMPAAALALLIDFGLGRVEKKLNTPGVLSAWYQHRKKIYTYTGLIFGGLIVFFIFFETPSKHSPIIIASKPFTEQVILADIMSELIGAKTHLLVQKKLNLGSTMLLQSALNSGQIDIYPEYTGTAYLSILKKPYQANITPKALYQRVKKAYQTQYEITWLQAFGFNNSESIAIREADAKRLQVRTISELVPYAPQMRLAAPPDFIHRDDGYPLLSARYQLHFKQINLMTPNLMYSALSKQAVDAITAFTTDGRIQADHLLILKDDKHVYPPYEAAPLIRTATLQKYPQLGVVLNRLHNRISNRQMQAMNYAVNVQHEAPSKVAHDFLISAGLL